MDISLLNYYIERIGFIIDDGKLFFVSKGNDRDFSNSYRIFLTSDSRDMLKFFGYDVTIPYDKLSERDLWSYLTSSTMLTQTHLSLTNDFKGPRAKNKYHKRFSDFLRKQFGSDYRQLDDKLTETWHRSAVSYFGIDNQYAEYLNQKKIVDKIFYLYEINVSEKSIDSYKTLQLFVRLHGVRSIAAWDDDKFLEKWKEMLLENWSNLVCF